MTHLAITLDTPYYGASRVGNVLLGYTRRVTCMCGWTEKSHGEETILAHARRHALRVHHDHAPLIDQGV